jgi:signal transduction histidine kinase
MHSALALEDGLLAALRHVVECELAGEFDCVTWAVEPEAEIACTHLSPLTAEVIFYAGREAMRNAARHARGDERSSPLHLALTVER